MNIVASINADQSLRNNSNRKRQRHKKQSRLRDDSGTVFKDLEFLDCDMPTIDQVDKFRRALSSKLNESSVFGKESNDNMDQEKVFLKVVIQNQEHPFFKRLWLARHVLDHESPLLVPECRELIRLNCGKWPVELNSAKSIRKCLRFDQLIVSLSGTSNVDANSVYAQKIYNYSDLSVGYQFTNALFHDETGCLVVDPNLLDMVEEQGGKDKGEPLDAERSNHPKDVMVL